MYHFLMPIGDWSLDGHGKVENFLISSNKPVEDVREAHYMIPETTGINIEEICSEYGENFIQPDVVKKLHNMGWKSEHGLPEMINPSPEDMATLWILLLMKVAPQLKLKIVPDKLAMLPFCSCDSKGRYIGQVGYGLFV